MMVSSQTRNSLIALKEQCQAGGPGVRLSSAKACHEKKNAFPQAERWPGISLLLHPASLQRDTRAYPCYTPIVHWEVQWTSKAYCLHCQRYEANLFDVV